MASKGEDLAAMLGELTSVEFALQELGVAFQDEGLSINHWPDVRHSLKRLRDRISSRLVDRYSSMSPLDGIDGLTGLIQRDPDSARAYLARGYLHQLNDDASSAETDYLFASALEATYAEPLMRLAVLYEEQGHNARAAYAYRGYLRVEQDRERRAAAENAVLRLGQVLRPPVAGPIEESPPRLAYLLSRIENMESTRTVDGPTAQRLIARFSERLSAFYPPRNQVPTIEDLRDAPGNQSVPSPVREPAARNPESIAESMAVQRAAPEPPEPREPTDPPRAPREPIDWGAILAAAFSERTLTTILAFGVLLVAISSIALLVDQWRASASYSDVWPRIQAILAGQFAMFLVAGHIVKERLHLRLSGLAIISLGALWVPFNIGAWMFRKFVAPGDVVLPGLGLPVDLPLTAWLIVAAVSTLAWALITYRYRGHLLTHGTVAAISATVALAFAVLGAPWEWSVASIAVLAVAVMAAGHGLQRTPFRTIGQPLFWTSQAVLLGVVGILLGFWAAGVITSYPLAVAGAAGTGLYFLASRYTSHPAYEYPLASLPVISLLYVLGESGAVPLRYFDLLLLGVAICCLLVAVRVRRIYTNSLLSRWTVLQPAFAVGYAALAVATVWPEVSQTSRTLVLYGVVAVTAASAWRSGRGVWSWLAASVLVAPVLMTSDLLGLPRAYWGIVLSSLAGAYIVASVALRRSAGHVGPSLVGGVVLTVAGLVWPFFFEPFERPNVAVLTLPLVMADLLAFGTLARHGKARSAAWITRCFFATVWPGRELPREENVNQLASAFFVALTGMVAATWATMLRLWFAPVIWTGVELAALAGAYFVAARWLESRDRRADARTLGVIAVALAASAALYHWLAAGLDWGLVGILYGDVALIAGAGLLWRARWTIDMVAAYLPLPFVLTLKLAGLDIDQWAVYWALLGLTYFAVAAVLGRRAAAPALYGLSYGLSAIALGLVPADSSGTMARWTLPMIAFVFGASAVLVQRQNASIDRLVEWAGRLLDVQVSPGRARQVAAIFFGLLTGSLAPAWVSLMLLWQGISGPVHAYNFMGWAFVFALVPMALRQHGRSYVAASLVLSVALAIAAVCVPFAFDVLDRGVLIVVLYGGVVLAALTSVQTRNPYPAYVAATLLPVPFLLTLDLAGLDALLWGTPLMCLSVGYLVLTAAIRGRPLALQLSPVTHVGWAISVLALAWTAAWAGLGLAGITADTTLTTAGERLYSSLALLLGSGAYATAAFRRGDPRLGHFAVWIFGAASGVVLTATPLSMRHTAVAIASAASVAVFVGAVIRSTRPGERLSEVFGLPLLALGYGAAATSVAVATVDLVARSGDVWTSNAVYLINVALLAGSGHLHRDARWVTLAAGLFILPFTLGVYELLGGDASLIVLPSAALAFGWAALAFGYLGVALVMETKAPREGASILVLAYLLLAAAVVASLGSAARQSVVFGTIVVVTIGSIVLIERGRMRGLSECVAILMGTSRTSARRFTAAVFAWVAALLTPLWALELLALFTTELSTQGIVLASIAPGYLWLGSTLKWRGRDVFAWPVLVAAHGMALVGPALTVLAWPAYGQAVAALALASVTMLMSAHLFRRSPWSYVSHVAAALFGVSTIARVISPLDLPREAYGLAVLALAMSYLLASVMTPRLVQDGRTTIAWRTVAFGLSGLGIGLAIPESREMWPLSTLAFGLGAAFYGAAALIMRSPALLYPALGLAAASYWLRLVLIPVEDRYLGLALVPGGAVMLALGFWFRHVARRPHGRFAGILGKSLDFLSPGLNWHGPFLLTWLGLSSAAVGLSVPYEIPRFVTLLAVTLGLGALLAMFRAQVLLYPLLLSAHLAWASLITLGEPGLARPLLGLLFVPAAVTMIALLAATRRTQEADWLRNLPRSAGGAFVLFGAADIGASLVLAGFADWAGLTACAFYAAFAAIATQITRIRLLAYVSTAFVTAAVIFASRLFGLGWSQAAVVWATQGFVMWWASRAAERSLWEAPLRNAGLRLSWFALAFVVAMVVLAMVDSARFASSLSDATAVLAVLGLLYLGASFVSRKIWLAYLAVGLLLVSWTVQAVDLEIPNAQAYTVPAGAYLLALAYFERRRGAAGRPVIARFLPGLIEVGAVLLLTVSSFWQAVVGEPSWPYAVLLALESIVLVLWGSVNRTRIPSLGGAIGFVADVLYQTTDLLAGMPGSVVGLTVGLLIVAVIVAIERKREQLISFAREWPSPTGAWHW